MLLGLLLQACAVPLLVAGQAADIAVGLTSIPDEIAAAQKTHKRALEIKAKWRAERLKRLHKY